MTRSFQRQNIESSKTLPQASKLCDFKDCSARTSEKAIPLSCFHTIHPSCMEIIDHRRCPTCLKPLLNETKRSSSSSRETLLEPSKHSPGQPTTTDATWNSGDDDELDLSLSRAEKIIQRGKLAVTPQFGTFTVMGFSGVPRVVRLYPKEYCSCGAKDDCYHKMAAKKSIGLEIKVTEPKRKRKPKGEEKMRKRTRAHNYDVVGPTNPWTRLEEGKEKEEGHENERGHLSIADTTLEPGNQDQVESCYPPAGPVWLKIGDLQLRQEEREILTHRQEWLNDRIIDAAQILLKRQFPHIGGLDTVLKAENLSFDSCRNTPCIQIVNRTSRKGKEGSHWLTLSTIDCEPSEMKIYDSAYESVSYDTLEAICNLVKYGLPPLKDDRVNLLIVDVDMQGKGEEDTCGLHAVANATSLGLQKDPAKITYNEKAMRKHLLNCLEKQLLTMFPHTPRSSLYKKGIKTRALLEVFCSCKRPDSGFYFECSGCGVWYHPECQNMSREDIPSDEKEPVYCITCQLNRKSLNNNGQKHFF
mgnify:CR=1 FL=1